MSIVFSFIFNGVVIYVVDRNFVARDNENTIDNRHSFKVKVIVKVDDLRSSIKTKIRDDESKNVALNEANKEMNPDKIILVNPVKVDREMIVSKRIVERGTEEGNIFDPRLRGKIQSARKGYRKNKRENINDYAALTGERFESYRGHCFSIKSLDGGMRDERVWTVKCRKNMTESEKILSGVNAAMNR